MITGEGLLGRFWYETARGESIYLSDRNDLSHRGPRTCKNPKPTSIQLPVTIDALVVSVSFGGLRRGSAEHKASRLSQPYMKRPPDVRVVCKGLAVKQQQHEEIKER